MTQSLQQGLYRKDMSHWLLFLGLLVPTCHRRVYCADVDLSGDISVAIQSTGLEIVAFNVGLSHTQPSYELLHTEAADP